MLGIGKYAAAARGPRNVGSQGGVSLNSLRSGTGSSGRVGARVTNTGGTARPQPNLPPPDPGLRIEKSAYIQPQGAVYEAVPRNNSMNMQSRGVPFLDSHARPKAAAHRTNYRSPGQDLDRRLSKLI